MSTQYKVVNSGRPERFEEQVTNLLNDGWELQGSPFISQTGGMTQAMTKTTTTKKSTKK